MIRDYRDFAVEHWRPLSFGALLMATSGFGQSWYVWLFGAAFRGAFGLSDGALGTVYAVGTLLSAVTFGWVGRWIDQAGVPRFAAGTALLLATACVVVALSPSLLVLALGFYLLRLGGQGLMAHTAMTATARAFPREAGRALGVIALGFSVAQAILPLGGVALLGWVGWRAAWGINAVLVLGLTALALLLLPRHRAAPAPAEARAATAAEGRSPWRDGRLWLALPAVLASPAITTAFFFHQARLAEEKGWTLEWLAAWFVLYAAVAALTALVSGPVIDRVGARRLLPLHLVPQGAAMLILFLTDWPWAVPFYLVLTALSAVGGWTLTTPLWLDLFGAGRLARVRASTEAAVVVACGVAPFLMGVLIDLGVALRAQALGCLGLMLLASLLCRPRRKRPRT